MHSDGRSHADLWIRPHGACMVEPSSVLPISQSAVSQPRRRSSPVSEPTSGTSAALAATVLPATADTHDLNAFVHRAGHAENIQHAGHEAKNDVAAAMPRASSDVVEHYIGDFCQQDPHALNDAVWLRSTPVVRIVPVAQHLSPRTAVPMQQDELVHAPQTSRRNRRSHNHVPNYHGEIIRIAPIVVPVDPSSVQLADSKPSTVVAMPAVQIQLVVKDVLGAETHVKINKYTSIKKIMDWYCNRTGKFALQFSVFGEVLNPDDTALAFDLQDGDTIDVVDLEPLNVGRKRLLAS